MKPPFPPFPRSAGMRLALLLFFLALVARPLGAQTADTPAPSPDSLKQLSVEDLMNLDVTSVTKAPERLLDAPSAIQVITSDDIEQSAASSLPEALRLADNLQVAEKDQNDWAISARGFNANLDDKLLVLIDGRAVYSPLYAGVIWNVQDAILEDVDRIEVISGPGGTLYGANAVNGVINITTKSAKDTQGLYLEEAGGSVLQDQTEARYGGTIAPDVYYRVYGSHSQRGSEDLPGGSSAGDALRMTRAGFRVDSEASAQNLMTLQGDYYNGTQDLGATGEGGLSGGNLLGRWTHTFADDSDFGLQVYYDKTHLAQPVPGSPAAEPYVRAFPDSFLVDDLDTYDLDLQRHFKLGEVNRFTMGFGYRYTKESDTDRSIIRFDPRRLDQSLYNAFVQDEIALTPEVALTLGTKVEHNEFTGYEIEPSGRLQWNFTPKEMVWAAVSRAVRTPSRYDRDLMVLTGLQNAPAPYVFPTTFLEGNDAFISETEIAYELGYRAELGAKASVSVSTYYNDYDSLRSTEATPTSATYPFPYPVYFANDLEGDTYGAELSFNYQVLEWWRMNAGYDYLRENIHVKPGYVDTTDGLNETGDPRNQVFLRSTMEFPKRFDLNAALRWIDTLTLDKSPNDGTLSGTVPSYFELDGRLGWRMTRQLELSLVGQNLLHEHHPEYGFPTDLREEIAREVFVKAEFRY
jgi:iron complex outermembrane receptor protein